MSKAIVALVLAGCVSAADSNLMEMARDRQDRHALQSAVTALASGSPNDARAQYRLAMASSYLAEVAQEQHDKNGARNAAEPGIRAAERLISLDPKNAEYHRILGTLCGQAAPASVLLMFKYGKCARESIDRAVALNPNSARNYLSRGVGNYYLPAAFGGGVELAIRDFRKAIQLDPQMADAHLWLGIALRKAQKNAEARKEILQSLALNPNRLWAKQQLARTPAR